MLKRKEQSLRWTKPLFYIWLVIWVLVFVSASMRTHFPALEAIQESGVYQDGLRGDIFSLEYQSPKQFLFVCRQTRLLDFIGLLGIELTFTLGFLLKCWGDLKTKRGDIIALTFHIFLSLSFVMYYSWGKSTFFPSEGMVQMTSTHFVGLYDIKEEFPISDIVQFEVTPGYVDDKVSTRLLFSYQSDGRSKKQALTPPVFKGRKQLHELCLFVAEKLEVPCVETYTGGQWLP